MIYCPEYNFNFLRVPKNASSSVADFLISNYALNHKTSIWTEVNDAGIPDYKFPVEVHQKYFKKYRWIHMTLGELVRHNVISEEKARAHDNITIIRNPYDRQLSLYFFLKRGQTKSVEEFRSIMSEGYYSTDPNNKILQTEYPKLNGEDLGTWWLYENLNTHIQEFRTAKNKPIRNPMKKHKSSWKPKDPALIDEYYDQATKDAVQRYFEADFEKYNELKGTGDEAV